MGPLALLAAVFLVYWPAIHGGFLWDDDAHISSDETLRLADGLWRIWFKAGATCQYYPLTFSIFWLEYHLWGLSTLGYHVVNVFLHGVVAILLWQVLRRLKVPGAWLAGSIFALHPVCVMSVAWMTELKNVLSATLALCAAWAYLRAAGLGIYEQTTVSPTVSQAHGVSPEVKLDWRFYVLSLVLFQLALFAKSAVCFLPVTLLLVTWWQGRRLNWQSTWPLIPMLLIALAAGWFTVHMEQNLVGASEARFQLSFSERLVVSGRSFWFYLGKLVFPHRLAFIYERWPLAPLAWWQYAFPCGVLVVLWSAWKWRARLGRGWFAVLAHFYVATSLLVLVVVLFMTHYTFVSDHWQYFGCMSVFAGAAAAIVRLLERIPRGPLSLKLLPCTALLAVLGCLTWRQCGMYTDLGTLWRATLERSPNSAMAHGSYANYLALSHQFEEAIREFHTALELEPENADARMNYGVTLAQAGRFDEAVEQERQAIAALDSDANSHYNLALALQQSHHWDEAVAEYRRSIQLQPSNSLAETGWANVLLEQGHPDEAIAHFTRATQLNPSDAVAHYNLGNLLFRNGRLDDAAREYNAAVQADPNYAAAHNNLATLDYQLGQLAEAADQFQKTVQLLPNDPNVRCNLGFVLLQAGRASEAGAQFEKALQIQPDFAVAAQKLADAAWTLATAPATTAQDSRNAIEFAEAADRFYAGKDFRTLSVLAAAYASGGRFTDAVAAGERALSLPAAQSNPPSSAELRKQLAEYQAGRPFRR